MKAVKVTRKRLDTLPMYSFNYYHISCFKNYRGKANESSGLVQIGEVHKGTLCPICGEDITQEEKQA